MLYVIKNNQGEYLQLEECQDGPNVFTTNINEARVYKRSKVTNNIEDHLSGRMTQMERYNDFIMNTFKGLTTQEVEYKVKEI